MGEEIQRQGLYIQLQNYSRPYRPGEKIIGQLYVVFKTPQEFKYLSVRLEGKAEVHWTRKVSRKSSMGARIRKTIHYRDLERYFLHRIKLLGHGADNWSGSTEKLEAGSSIYPFTFTLPQNLPTSFRSLDNVARVLYQITARLKKPWFNYDIFTTIPFQVSGMCENDEWNEDLLSSEMRQPFILERSRMLRQFICYSSKCFFGRSGSSLICCKMRLPQRIFTPGDVIPIQLHITNEDGESYYNNVTLLSLTLIQNIVYRTRRHRLKASFEICKAILCPGQEEIIVSSSCNGGYLMLLKIPPQSCPTNLGGRCKLINLQYMLKFNVDFGPFSKNLKGKVPVRMSSIPVMTKEDEY